MANKGTNGRTNKTEGRTRDAMTIDLKLPIAKPQENAYQSPRVDVMLNPAQTLAMRRLLDGLQQRQAKLSNGRLIQANADVVRYLLERVHEKIKAATAGN